MKAAQLYVGLVVVVMAFGFEGCSSNSSDKAQQSQRSPTGECYSSSDGDSSVKCPQKDTYDACLQKACGAKYQTCLGSGYMTGSYSGTCKSEMECLVGCPCEDTTCAMACYQNATTACVDCLDAATSCEETSGCTEPVCGAAGTGGTDSMGVGGASGIGGLTSTGQGGTSSTSNVGDGGSIAANSGGSPSVAEGGASPAGVCPYSVTSLDCSQACTNLKAVATKCQSDPTLSEEIRAVLQLASSGSGNACKAGCAASSPSAMAQWKCYQSVPTSADCTAIAGCTYYNCP